jgi:hypothetical protein
LRRHYDWKRYWFDRRPAGEWLDGYLRAEEDAEWFDEGANAWQLSELTEEPCLVLLGEAGLGKSESLREAARVLEERTDRERELVHLYDLGADESPELLKAGLMGGRQWDEWVNGGKVLHLFLDSFDEALINQKALGKLLVRELEAVPEALPRLRLRIASRGVEWPSQLSNELTRIMGPSYSEWSGDLPRELVLAQLAKTQAGLAAEAEGLDRWVFLGSIADRDLEGLAALPLTLKMLLEAAKESGELSDSRKDLFEQTTRRLVAEYDDMRPRPGTGALQPGQRLAVAERIAAAALFSGHRTIAKDSGKVGLQHLGPAALAGHSEEDADAAGGAAFLVDAEQIVEVLRTGLFVDAGRDAVRFRHRSLTEFLAASYLVRHGLDEDQLLSLFTVSSGSRRELIPRLREVAAWTAAIHPRILQKLLVLDRQMLPRIGRLHLSAEQADEIVAGLLADEISLGGNPGDNRRLWPALRSLTHPGLAEALREPILDSRAPVDTRGVAVGIAAACELRESEGDLLKLALDPQEEPDLRALAVHGLGRFATAKSRRALVPLALEPIADDEDDEIKGFALLATFPGQIDVETVFRGLTPPHKTYRFGNYQYFLSERLPQALTLADLPAALRWAAEVTPNESEYGGPADDFNFLVDRILTRAWPHMGDAGIAAGVAAVVRRRLWTYRRAGLMEELSQDGDDDGERRHALLERLIDEVGDDPAASGEIHPDGLLESTPPLLSCSDLGWLLEKLEGAIGTTQEARWAALSARVSTSREPEFGRIFDLAERSEELRARLGPLLGPIALDTDLAQRLRRAGYDGEPDPAVPADAPYLEQVISEALDRLEEGDQEGWLRLTAALTYGPRGQDVGCDPAEPDIVSMPGWKRADRVTRAQIVAAAHSYLREADPQAKEWFGQKEPTPKAVAGYRALRLLDRVCRVGSDLDRDVWARWVPAILSYSMKAPDDRYGLLVTMAARRAPDEFADWAARKVDREAAEGDGPLPFLKVVSRIRTASLSAALLPRLGVDGMRPCSVADLLAWGLERDWVRSVQLVEPRLADEAIAHDAEARETAILAAAGIFSSRPAAGWPLVRRLLRRDRDLGAAILLHAAETIDARGSALEALPDGELVELLDALFDLFPPDDVPAADFREDASRRARVEELRSLVQAELAERGTEEAVATLRDIAGRYPDDYRGNRRLRAALKAFADRRKGLMEPQQIIQICCGKDPGLISSDADLQQAVIASLGRIERSLQRAQPRAAPDLWEKSPVKPRHEEEISNWLKRRLSDDLSLGGLEVNREVLSEPNKTGKGIGERIDIQLSAPMGQFTQGAENARVVIEVKASWDKKLRSAMEEQLIDQYLRRAPTSHGIFVVLRFAAEDWAPDWRRAPSARMSLEEMREFFAKQADELSSRGEACVRSVVLDCSL